MKRPLSYIKVQDKEHELCADSARILSPEIAPQMLETTANWTWNLKDHIVERDSKGILIVHGFITFYIDI